MAACAGGDQRPAESRGPARSSATPTICACSGSTPDTDDRADDLHARPPRADRGQFRRRLQRSGRRNTISRWRCRPTQAAARRRAPRPPTSRAPAGRASCTSTPTRTPSSTPTCRRRAMPARRQCHPTASPAACIPIPSAELHLAFWGIGAHSNCFRGTSLAGVAKIAADVAADHRGLRNRPGRHRRPHSRLPAPRRRVDAAGQPRGARADAIGRQILASLIAEQVAYHDYQTVKTQVPAGAGRPEPSCRTSSPAPTSTTGCRANRRPLLPVLPLRLRHRPQGRADHEAGADAPGTGPDQFIQFNYWDTGHQGLLSGEALISTSSGWRWPITTTTSASWN